MDRLPEQELEPFVQFANDESNDLGGYWNKDGIWILRDNQAASLVPADPSVSFFPSESLFLNEEVDKYPFHSVNFDINPIDYSLGTQQSPSPQLSSVPGPTFANGLVASTDKTTAPPFGQHDAVQSRPPSSTGAEARLQTRVSPILELQKTISPSRLSRLPPTLPLTSQYIPQSTATKSPAHAFQSKGQHRTPFGVVPQPPAIYPTYVSRQSLRQPRTQKDLSRYHGPRLQDMPRFRMDINPLPASDFISGNHDLRHGIQGHLFLDSSRFGFGPAPGQSSSDADQYVEKLALSPTRPAKRKRDGSGSPASDMQDTQRPEKRQKSKSAPSHEDYDDIFAGENISPVPRPEQPVTKRGKIVSSGGRVTIKNPKTKGLNSRPAKIESFDAKATYTAPRPHPAPWDISGHSFEYNNVGELVQPVYSTDAIQEFIYNNRGNFIQHPTSLVPQYAPKQGTFTLWIQNVPADSRARYIHEASDKCRFADCILAPKRTIHKGSHRVAFDENPESGEGLDPYYVAGYVHLWCLEKLLDFPRICRDLNVRPDTRMFPREQDGKNKMSIVRDHKECEALVCKFLKEAKTVPKDEWTYEGTLQSHLTEMHLELQPDGKHRARRDKEAQNHIGIHRNDLEKFVEGQARKATKRKKECDGEYNISTGSSRKRPRR